MTKSSKPSANEQPVFEFSTSRQFTAWMNEQHVSLALTTYQTGKLFLFGTDNNGQLSILNRTLNRVMGLSINDNRMLLSDLYQLWSFENSLNPGQTYNGYDRCYIPQKSWVTGDLDIHDIAVGKNGRPFFVNTLFSCIAQVSDTHSFSMLWKPPFISKLAAEDRCHMNGMATIDNEPRYVTCVSKSDVGDGWRDHRENGGVVIDVKSNTIVLDGLSMPHSPRWHQNRLWLLDSGNGYFGYLDEKSGSFEKVCLCPGFARGLSFIGDFAVIGLSLPRHNRTFDGLELDNQLAHKNTEPRCGLAIVDLRTGDMVHSMRITGAISELYDIAVLANTKNPMAIGFQNDEIRRMISVGDSELPAG